MTRGSERPLELAISKVAPRRQNSWSAARLLSSRKSKVWAASWKLGPLRGRDWCRTSHANYNLNLRHSFHDLLLWSLIIDSGPWPQGTVSTVVSPLGYAPKRYFTSTSRNVRVATLDLRLTTLHRCITLLSLLAGAPRMLCCELGR